MGIISIRIDDTRELFIHHRDHGSDRAVIGQIWENREYDPNRLRRWPDLQRQMNGMLERGRRPLILDAGANIGASPLFFADFFRGSVVVALEPEPNNFELLQRNAHQLDNIICVNGALASSETEFEVIDTALGDWGFRAQKVGAAGDAASPKVKAFSVPALLDMAPPGTEPFILKMDIEGGEEEVFSKNIAWIDRFPLIIIELHDWMLPGQANSRNFLCAVAASGRDFVQIGENTFSIRN